MEMSEIDISNERVTEIEAWLRDVESLGPCADVLHALARRRDELETRYEARICLLPEELTNMMADGAAKARAQAFQEAAALAVDYTELYLAEELRQKAAQARQQQEAE